MDAKLKALKVADLKHILSAAAVSSPAKATKADLIAKILASPPALDAYAAKYAPPPAPADTQTDDLLAPPEEVDWNADDPTPVADVSPQAPPVATSTSAKPNPQSHIAPSKPHAPASTAELDNEAEKRRKRAERFGIPLVQPSTDKRPAKVLASSALKAVAEDPDKLKARAQRFGITTSAPHKPAVVAMGQKRAAPPEPVDEEELARRKKRAERFGISLST